MQQPEMLILYFLGKFENSRLSVSALETSWSCGVPSMISSGSIPATGQPTMFRVSSPQAPLVVIPTDSSSAKITGISSMRSQ